MGYWEERYGEGGTSGKGSVGPQRDWKWKVIESHAAPVDDVVDVGCGDLSFWEGRGPPGRYIGVDISRTIVERDRESWPGATFVCSSADVLLELERARTVLCLDVLFHIMDDSVYEKILSNLTKYSKEWIFVHTWSRNPFSGFGPRVRAAGRSVLQGKPGSAFGRLRNGRSDGRYQKFREFDSYMPIFAGAGFELLASETNPEVDQYGTMYVFRLKGS